MKSITRPVFETPEDRAREKTVADLVAAKWKCDLFKTPDRYAIDYLLTRNRTATAVCEIKSRFLPWAEVCGYGGYLLNVSKWLSAHALCSSMSLPFLLVVRADDGIWFREFAPMPLAPGYHVVVYGCRKDRPDQQDGGPSFRVPSGEFTRLE
jgi:hypothetical protein